MAIQIPRTEGHHVSDRIACCAVLLAAVGSATAQTLTARGSYLVDTIMACGNCHTPRMTTAGPSPAGLSGGG